MILVVWNYILHQDIVEKIMKRHSHEADAGGEHRMKQESPDHVVTNVMGVETLVVLIQFVASRVNVTNGSIEQRSKDEIENTHLGLLLKVSNYIQRLV